MKAMRWAVTGTVLAVMGCGPAPEQATGPHPSIWPCDTVHAELQRQEEANKGLRKTQDSITWIPVVGIAGFAIKPDRTRERHLSTRAYECKLRGGI